MLPIIRAILDLVLEREYRCHSRKKIYLRPYAIQSTQKISFRDISSKTVQHGNVSPDLQTMLYYSQKYTNESDFNYLKLSFIVEPRERMMTP